MHALAVGTCADSGSASSALVVDDGLRSEWLSSVLRIDATWVVVVGLSRLPLLLRGLVGHRLSHDKPVGGKNERTELQMNRSAVPSCCLTVAMLNTVYCVVRERSEEAKLYSGVLSASLALPLLGCVCKCLCLCLACVLALSPFHLSFISLSLSVSHLSL